MSELKEFFPENILDKAGNVAVTFHGDVLIDNKLFASDAILVALYMLSNKHGNNGIDLESVQELYLKSGKTKDSFRKAIYELTKRNKAGMLTKTEDDKLIITYSGLSHVEKLLNGEYKKK